MPFNTFRHKLYMNVCNFVTLTAVVVVKEHYFPLEVGEPGISFWQSDIPNGYKNGTRVLNRVLNTLSP